jgi:hypothetical protein
MTRLAPVSVFAFNRPDHLRRTLTSLRQCAGFDESPVIVFGDGPRHEGQRAQVLAARAVAREILGESAEYRFSDVNKGLGRSIIDGVAEILEKHGRIIVIEDDFDLAPGFLTFLNAALDHYADCPQVYQISGYMFDAPEFRDRETAVMLPLTTTWGWATWSRAWRIFDENAAGWRELASDRKLRRRFNLDDVYDYASMMWRQMNGRIDSWGIRWYWAVFRREGLAVFPPRSLVRNVGMDGSGSHGRGVFRRYKETAREFPTTTFQFPTPVLDELGFKAVRQAIWRQNGGAVGKLIDDLKKLAIALAEK